LTSYNTLAYFGPTEKSLRRLPPAADRDLVDIGVDAGAGPVGQFIANFYFVSTRFLSFLEKKNRFSKCRAKCDGQPIIRAVAGNLFKVYF
jgi:hypothetical protein